MSSTGLGKCLLPRDTSEGRFLLEDDEVPPEDLLLSPSGRCRGRKLPSPPFETATPKYRQADKTWHKKAALCSTGNLSTENSCRQSDSEQCEFVDIRPFIGFHAEVNARENCAPTVDNLLVPDSGDADALSFISAPRNSMDWERNSTSSFTTAEDEENSTDSLGYQTRSGSSKSNNYYGAVDESFEAS